MKKVETYSLSDEEYEYFANAVMHINCPDLGDHDCSLCPMYVNVNRYFPKDPEYRCLLDMMENRLRIIKEMRDGEV